MYIIHFIGTNFVGGPEKQILSHLGELHAAGFRLMLLSFEETGGYELERQSASMGIRCELLPAQRMAIPSVLANLYRIYKKEKPTIICAHGYKATFYALLLKLIAGGKVISFSRGWTGENFSVKLYGWFDKMIIRFSDRIVAVSYSQKAKLRKVFVPDKKIRVVHNAMTEFRASGSENDASDVRDELGLKKSAQIVFTAGRLSPEKGHHDLVKAAAIVVSKRPDLDVHFVIAGDGPLEAELRAAAVHLGIANRVHFLGFRRNISSLYGSATLFVLPSHSEGLPNVLLEAMGTSVPIVSTNVGGVPELVAHGESGLLVDANRPEALADQIILALEDQALCHRLKTNALELVRNEFSKDRQSRLLLDIYREVESR